MGYSVIVILSDIHGNIEALRAVVSDLDNRGFDCNKDTLVSLGDQVGYGPRPLEVLEELGLLGAFVLSGNHENAVLGYEDLRDWNTNAVIQIQWTREQLKELPNLEEVLRNNYQIDKAIFVHGGFTRDADFSYIQNSWEANWHLGHEHFGDWNVGFFGHTHVPIGYSIHNKVIPYQENTWIDLDPTQRSIINPGAVGQPRCGDPRASYCIYNPDTNQFKWIRVEYDIEATIQDMKNLGLYRPNRERLREGA